MVNAAHAQGVPWLLVSDPVSQDGHLHTNRRLVLGVRDIEAVVGQDLNLGDGGAIVCERVGQVGHELCHGFLLAHLLQVLLDRFDRGFSFQ